MNNRFELPNIYFFEKTAEQIEREMLTHIEGKTGITLENADPRRKFIQGLTAYIVQQRIEADYAFKQNLLSYAAGEYLDHKGLDTDTKRLQSKPAQTIVRFTLEPDRVDALLIPAGTRLVVGETYFQTLGDFVAAVGQTEVEIPIEASEPGAKGNGFLAGEITKLVDVLPWIKKVENISATEGGADTEDDDAYAERLRIAPEKFSTAGPSGAYEYWAYTADQTIADVKVHSPMPGNVDITVLCSGGTLPSQAILKRVEEICGASDVRPLTDRLFIKPPEIVPYSLTATYYINARNATVTKHLQNQIETAFFAYLIWQKEKIGRNKDFTELIKMLKNAGASRVEIAEELYTQITALQVAVDDGATLSFGGLENA